MNLLALLGALIASYYRPHQQLDLLHTLVQPYLQWLERSLNDGRNRHGVLAWFAGAFVPALVLGIAYYALLWVNVLLGLVFGIVILYFTLRFSRYGQHAEQIVSALRVQDLDQARMLYGEWEGKDASGYNATEIARLGIETTLKRAHQGLFAPILWFVLLGPGGALLYRLALLLKLEWHTSVDGRFCKFSRQAFEWLDWLPARFTAASFAVVGDFEDAIYCWRMQAQAWSDKALGIVLASGAGALGVRLGEPLSENGIMFYRPELGMGDEADADYLQGAVALVWRVLVVMVGLLVLLTFAYWLGN